MLTNYFCDIAANGKSIGEDGQKGIRRIQFCRVEANAFSWKLNYKKSWNEKQLAAKNIQIFNLDIQARFCQYRVICSLFFVLFLMVCKRLKQVH